MSDLSKLKGDLNKVAKFCKNILAAQEAVEIVLSKENLIKDLEKDFTVAQGQLTDIQAQVEEAQDELETVKAGAGSVVAEARESAKEIIKTAETEAAALVDVEKGEIGKLKAQKKALKADLKSLAEEISGLSTEKTKLEKKITKLKKQLGDIGEALK